MELNNLIKQAGISRNTIRKYVQYGLIERPEVNYGGQTGGSVSHYPEDSLRRIELIKILKSKGKTLKEIKEILPKVITATIARDYLEKNYEKMERGISSSDLERWLQLSVELMLREAGVSADEISKNNLSAWLSDIKVERAKNGEVEAIRIEKDPKAKSELEAAIDKMLQS